MKKFAVAAFPRFALPPVMFPVTVRYPATFAPVPVTTMILALPFTDRFMFPDAAGILMLLVPFACEPIKFDPVTLPMAWTIPPVIMFPPVIFPVAPTVPAVDRLPAVNVPTNVAELRSPAFREKLADPFKIPLSLN